MTVGATAAAMLIAVRLLAPVCDPGPFANERAPASVRCERCEKEGVAWTWVTALNAWEYSDFTPEVVDSCQLIHYHNTGKRGATYHCVRCCHEWTVEEWTGGPCWCGWEPSDGTPFVDACSGLPESR